jgi:diguanylate cyclase (GGDEF)-like protein
MAFRSGLSILRSVVARRLLLLFLFTALLPMLMAAWLSSAAIAELSAQVDQRLLGRDTRHVGLQVLDRLLVAKGLMQSWPTQPPDGGLPGQGRMFEHIAAFDAQGRVAWTAGDAARLVRHWRQGGLAAERDTVPEAAGPASAARPSLDVRLHLIGLPGDRPRVALEGRAEGTTRWLAVLDPQYLWAPMADAGDAAWTVQQPDGTPLIGFEPASDPAPEEPQRTGRWNLFLAAEFGAADWVFTQRRPATRAVWFGRPLEQWLGLVAAATVLVVASVSLTQVRSTLGALGRLSAGTRKLAAGDTGARVRLDTRDEFGDLARAFNHMARRIEQQWQSLRGLAKIDRAILEGVDIASVARHVLRPLQSLGAGTTAALLWLDDPADGALEGLLQSPGDKAPRRLPPVSLSAARHRELLQWQVDRRLSGSALEQASGVPWLAPVCLPGTAEAHCLPVHWNGRTQAVLLIGLRRPLDSAAMQPAIDLRERLAVAFSARERERALVHRALHDSLTGLANRHGLHERLDDLLQTAGRCAMLFVDLDRFKQVNDTLGHAAGDEVLRQASQRLATLAPPDALVARPGGDEFVIVCPGGSGDAALALGRAVCANLALPFHLGGQEHVLGASVGIACAPDHARGRDELMRAADLAMYAAKGLGRGRCTVFTPRLDAELRERLQLQVELRQALARDELVLHYQPRVQPGGGRILSAEALVRWQHPQRGLLPPGVFVPVAEESELIEALGLWVLEAACAQMARWQRAGLGLARVSVNVSSRQLASGRLPAEVREALERHGITPHQLELEVTESLLVGDATSAREQLAELRRWGITIALDDFGTGYSSMSMLRELPIDVMKVDRAFVKDLGRDDAALAVTRAILALAGSLRMHTVAEGVETVEQAAQLAELGCDELQGYLYAKPLPAEAFARLPQLAAQRRPALA